MEGDALLNDAAPALAVEEVSYAYGRRRALDDVSLAVERGERVILLGPNGAGKTTLLSLITGLFHAEAGRVRILGHDVAAAPRHALARLGVVFQARTLDPDLGLLRNLTYHAALHGLSAAEGRRRATALLERFGLGDRATDRARDLSGGEARRVEIARALLHRPQLLVLDEATVGLDARSRRDILTTVGRLVSEDGIGVLWTTHLFDEVTADDRVVILHRGRILAQGTAAAIAAASPAGTLAARFRELTEEEGADIAASRSDG
jgi:ABC-2 type transport system ATP-binding protein